MGNVVTEVAKKSEGKTSAVTPRVVFCLFKPVCVRCRKRGALNGIIPTLIIHESSVRQKQKAPKFLCGKCRYSGSPGV